MGLTALSQLTSSQVGTLFAEAWRASHRAELWPHAKLSKICSSMLFRCFTMSLESPSSERITTSITWAGEKGEDNVVSSNGFRSELSWMTGLGLTLQYGTNVCHLYTVIQWLTKIFEFINEF